MDKENLEAKKEAVEAEFNELEEQKNNIIKRQYELRGSYQTYEKEIADLATTIIAQPKKVVKNGKWTSSGPRCGRPKPN